MNLHDAIEHVLMQYPIARTQTLSNHPLTSFIRRPLAAEVRSRIDPRFIVKASPGAGEWAECPWVAAYEPSVTTTAQRGFYVVYLFRGDGQAVFLTIAQSEQEIRDKGFHHRDVLNELKARAAVKVGLLRSVGIDDLDTGPIDLGGHLQLAPSYAASVVVSRRYAVNALPDDDTLTHDLQRFVRLYEDLIDAQESINEATSEPLPEGVGPGLEAARFRWHRRAERRQWLIDKAKAFHGRTCQVCGFNFKTRYGTLGDNYIEAHHLTPMAVLARLPQAAMLDPKTDFAVVCANCHRMLHQGKTPPTVQELKGLLG